MMWVLEDLHGTAARRSTLIWIVINILTLSSEHDCTIHAPLPFHHLKKLSTWRLLQPIPTDLKFLTFPTESLLRIDSDTNYFEPKLKCLTVIPPFKILEQSQENHARHERNFFLQFDSHLRCTSLLEKVSGPSTDQPLTETTSFDEYSQTGLILLERQPKYTKIRSRFDANDYGTRLKYS